MQHFQWHNSFFLGDFQTFCSASSTRIPAETVEIKLNFHQCRVNGIKRRTTLQSLQRETHTWRLCRSHNSQTGSHYWCFSQRGGKYMCVCVVSPYYPDCPASIRSVESEVNMAHGGWRVHNGAHLIIIDPEISLLGPQVPLHNCPTFKTYEQLKTDTTQADADKDILNQRHWEKRQRAERH